jgi:hypothetical protein
VGRLRGGKYAYHPIDHTSAVINRRTASVAV